MSDRADDLPGYNPNARAARAKRIPIWRWVLWHLTLMAGMFVFYVCLTPFWIGLRGVAWVAEFRSRRRRARNGRSQPGSAA
ncbi:MAG TPA: hypothetical protein VLJ76_00315 [Gaiellaceae bacterium]|nr:hypothetical protein [Gaiellaceae bacterium]